MNELLIQDLEFTKGNKNKPFFYNHLLFEVSSTNHKHFSNLCNKSRCFMLNIAFSWSLMELFISSEAIVISGSATSESA